LGTCIKIFPAAAGSALLFHPRKARYVLLCVAGGAIMLLAPLLVTSPAVLLQQYAWWHAVESKDALDRMYSVMQQVHLWLGVDWPNWPQQLAGVVLLLLPVALRRSRLGERAFQQLFLASLLMFCVLFNHQSESPTFVIAVCGVALWFLATPRSAATWALLAFVFVGTTLVKSDVMPRAWQRAFFDPTYFKTVPVLVTWVVTQVQLWRAPSAHAEVHELDVAAREPGT
ncbi:MAG TPA: hypothetical protein VG818_00905, partial [Gemmatimonadaceae bacterium]|nr:hypothetical protein [Gemmatimonadaceae bacterium]